MTILAYNTGGISNRIKNIVSCFRVDSEVYVYWNNVTNYDHINYHLFICPYEKLFSFPKEVRTVKNIEKGKQYPVYDKDKLIILDEDGLPHNFAQFDSKCAKPYRYTDEFNRNIDFEYERVPLNVRETFIQLFKKIRLNSDVQDRINKFYDENMKGKNIVSVHIRSWNRENEEGRGHLHNVDRFIEKMKSYENQYFFLSSDSTEVIEKVRLEVNNVIIFDRQTDRKSSRTNPDALVEDLIELYLLGKGNSLIGSHFSSYSEVAWYLMECPEVLIL